MRVIPRAILLALAATVGAVAGGQAQTQTQNQTQAPPAGKAAGTTTAKGKAAAPAPATPPALTPEALKRVVATVNGAKITEGELVNLLNKYQLPPAPAEQIYRDAVDSLVNSKLIEQFLTRQRITAPQAKVDEAIARMEQELKASGSSLPAALQESGMSLDQLRAEYAPRIRWVEYLNLKATDAELKKFAANNKDLFNGTQVKVSHILLMVEPQASPADKEQVKQKLAGIKKDIEAQKVSFAEAANKHSEDPANSEKAGGDLGYFARNSGLIDEFADAAFAAPKGTITGPVETPYGYHLIQVTDRKEGKPFDFEQIKPLVKQFYAAELMKDILESERKTAKIQVETMPSDLRPFLPQEAPEPAAAGAAPASPSSAPTAKDATPK